jgi:hypothetical protein
MAHCVNPHTMYITIIIIIFIIITTIIISR